MQKVIKITASLIGLLIILAIAAVVCLVTFVNPNDFKDQITAKVAASTGRQLNINGDIKWSFFPWLGLQLNQISLSNAKGFGDQPFAQIAHADVKVQLLPLFKGNINIGKLALDGLQLNLMKNAQGITNWQDLTTRAQAQADTNDNPPANTASNDSSGKSTHKLKFAIEGIDINNSSISWEDQQKGQTVKISDLAVQTGQLSMQSAFPLSVKFNINSNQPAVNGNFALTSDVTGDLAGQIYSFQNLKLTSTLNDKAFAGGKLDMSLQGNVKANLAKENLTIDSLNAKIANLAIHGDIQGQQILSNLQLQGQIDIPSFNLKQLLAALGHPLPARQDPNALTQVSAKGDLQGTANSLKIDQFIAKLDSTNIAGNFAVTDFSKKALVFNFNIDQLDADKYLAAPTRMASANNGVLISSAQAAPAPSNQPLLPVDMLRQLNMQGRLAIGSLHLNKLDATAINMQLNAQNGLINLAPLSAKLYAGNYNGSIRIDVRGKTPVIATDNQLTGIQIEPLTQSLINITKLQMTGTGNLNVNITTQGNTEAAVIKNLNGKGRIGLNNGVLKGINLPYYVRVGRALINGSSPPAKDSDQTQFGNLTGTFVITNGVFNNNDLLIAAPTFQAKGSGSANLVSQYLNYRIVMQLLETGTKNPQGDAIPVNISGNFSDVSVRPDVESIVKQEAKKRLGSTVTKELQKQLGNDTGKQVGDAVNSVINQFLGN